MPDKTTKKLQIQVYKFFQRVRMPFPRDLKNTNPLDPEATTNHEYGYRVIPGRLVRLWFYLSSAWANQGMEPTSAGVLLTLDNERLFWEPVQFFDERDEEMIAGIAGAAAVKTADPRPVDLDSGSDVFYMKFVDEPYIAPKHYGGPMGGVSPADYDPAPVNGFFSGLRASTSKAGDHANTLEALYGD